MPTSSNNPSGLSITSSDECWEAYWGVYHGDLEPLADFLERETGTLTPLLQRALANLIRGKHRTHKIAISRKEQGAPRSRDRRMDARISAFVKASKEPQMKNAVADAMKEFGLSRAAIYDAMKQHEAAMTSLRRFMKAHGVSS